jgi:CxxC motif-containing protein (DUF1111 family)
MTKKKIVISLLLTLASSGAFYSCTEVHPPGTSTTRDPGIRSGAAGAGEKLANLTPTEEAVFLASKADFEEVENVKDDGLGPTMNLDSCAGCHLQPKVGGSSPPVNLQIAFAKKDGATNIVPSFLTLNGPMREARFVKNPDGSPDGGVHALFTVAGLEGAKTCKLAQPDFEKEVARHNVTFRIPTPLFGAGLIEQIPDHIIVANQKKDQSKKKALKIGGRTNIVLPGNAISGQANNNGNDGTVARFGWKAQNKSLLLFSGEAYNVEMGITNELFQTERDETPECLGPVKVPNDVTNTGGTTPSETMSSIEKFSFFARFLAPPTPSLDTPGGADSIASGRKLFTDTGCALCHTPTLHTGNNAAVTALNNQSVNLFSDLLVHDMGPRLSDRITQGQAGPSEFRTAPLWGLGQRVFFLHDGRTSDLREAIQEHRSGSFYTGNTFEASGVIENFNALYDNQKQDMLNFLRSL